MGYSFKLAAFVGALLVACGVGLPPTPVMHTRSEHYMHLEIESNLVEEGSDYSEGKEVHIAILRVVFDQPLFVDGRVSIANTTVNLDGLTRLRCGHALLESHCHSTQAAVFQGNEDNGRSGRNLSTSAKQNLAHYQTCDHVFTTPHSESGAHIFTRHVQHRHDKEVTVRSDLSNVYTAFVDLRKGPGDPIRRSLEASRGPASKLPKCVLMFLPPDEQTVFPPPGRL